MIARPKRKSPDSAASIRERFLCLLPMIDEQAHFAFRHEQSERRQELVAEVAANAFVAFVRLLERGLEAIIYPTPLAQYAIKQIRDGRRVGCKLNIRDVSSEYAQQAKHITVERLDRYDAESGQWTEILLEDRKAGPAETAAARMDIADWFSRLPKKKRRIAATLATGETTKRAARKFHVTPGRISQTRRELEKSWGDFQGGPAFA